MFSSTTCAVCIQARRWLQTNGVPFRECMIDTDAACKASFVDMRGVGTPIFQVGERRLVGFDPQRLTVLLARGGPMLGQ